MKRLILLSAMVALIFGSATAQEATGPVLLNYKILQKKAAKSDEAIQAEKTAVKPTTWISRGKLFQDVDNQGLEQAQLGMDETMLKVTYKDPVSVETTEDNKKILKYDYINYIFENGRLRGWTRNEPIVEKPLDEALKSYKKAIDLTEESKRAKLEDKLKPQFDELKTQFQRYGQNQYYLENYKDALYAFEAILDVNKFEVYNGLIDTLMVNYSGIVARELGRQAKEAGNEKEAEEMYRKTIKYYQDLAEIGSGGSSAYIQMTRDFYAIGDTLGAIENLKHGLELYPDSTILVTVTAQAYYLMKDNEGGLEFIQERLNEKPQCPAAYYWKGLLITNKSDVEEDLIKEALAYYDTSLMYDPTNANVWYQSGYVNYAVGANYFEQESYEEDPGMREELNKKGVGYYEASVEKLEKAISVAAGDRTIVKEALDLLKRMYYKLYGGDDERYLDVNERLKNL